MLSKGRKSCINMTEIFTFLYEEGITTDPVPPVYLSLSNTNIACDGNSLTVFPNNTSNYPFYLKQKPLLSTATVHNFGKGGQWMSMMIADAVTQVDAVLDPTKVNILIVWEVINAFFDPAIGGNKQNVYNEFVQYCQARKAAGWYVVVLTSPAITRHDWPYGVARVLQQYVNDVNKLIRTNYKTFADQIVDVALDSRFATWNPTYFSIDEVHLSVNGYQLIAELVYQELQKIPS